MQKAHRAVNIICPNPNCDFSGPAREKDRGSTTLVVWLVLILPLLSLLIFFPLSPVFFVFGIWYYITQVKTRYYCPKCNIQAGDNK